MSGRAVINGFFSFAENLAPPVDCARAAFGHDSSDECLKCCLIKFADQCRLVDLNTLMIDAPSFNMLQFFMISGSMLQ